MLQPEILPCPSARRRQEAHRLEQALELTRSRMRTLDELREKVEAHNARVEKRAGGDTIRYEEYGARHSRAATLYQRHHAVLVVRELPDHEQ